MQIYRKKRNDKEITYGKLKIPRLNKRLPQSMFTRLFRPLSAFRCHPNSHAAQQPYPKQNRNLPASDLKNYQNAIFRGSIQHKGKLQTSHIIIQFIHHLGIDGIKTDIIFHIIPKTCLKDRIINLILVHNVGVRFDHFFSH